MASEALSIPRGWWARRGACREQPVGSCAPRGRCVDGQTDGRMDALLGRASAGSRGTVRPHRQQAPGPSLGLAPQPEPSAVAPALARPQPGSPLASSLKRCVFLGVHASECLGHREVAGPSRLALLLVRGPERRGLNSVSSRVRPALGLWTS